MRWRVVAAFAMATCGDNQADRERDPPLKPQYACQPDYEKDGAGFCVPVAGCGSPRQIEGVVSVQSCRSNANGQLRVVDKAADVDVVVTVVDAATGLLDDPEFDPGCMCGDPECGGCGARGLIPEASAEVAYDDRVQLAAVIDPAAQYYPQIVGRDDRDVRGRQTAPTAVTRIGAPMHRDREGAESQLRRLDPAWIAHFFFDERYAPAIREYCLSAAQLQTLLAATDRPAVILQMEDPSARTFGYVRPVKADDLPGREELRIGLGETFRLRFIGPTMTLDAEDYAALMSLAGAVNLYVAVPEDENRCEPFFRSGQSGCEADAVRERLCNGPSPDPEQLDGRTFTIDCLFAGCFADPPAAAALVEQFSDFGSCRPSQPPVGATFRREGDRWRVTAAVLHPQSRLQDPLAPSLEGEAFLSGDSGCFQWGMGDLHLDTPMGQFVLEQMVAFGEFSPDLNRIDPLGLTGGLDTGPIEEYLGIPLCGLFSGVCDGMGQIRLRLEGAEARVSEGPPMVSNRCGNGIVEAGEACDEGWNNGGSGRCNLACTGTVLPTCGNGRADPPLEGCDGFSDALACLDRGCYPSSRPCLSDCSGYEPYCRVMRDGCGDGLRTGCEACDDANLDDSDGCDRQCHRHLTCGEETGAVLDALDPATGHCYVSFADQRGWEAAQQFCGELGGHLAVIDNPAEWEWIRTVIPPGATAWIGVHDRDVEAGTNPGAFQSVLGGPIPLSFFGEGEPNAAVETEDCVEMEDNGDWNDLECDLPNLWVCELP